MCVGRDFYSYEGYYANAPEPFEESTNFIRPQLLRMRLTQYSVRLTSLPTSRS